MPVTRALGTLSFDWLAFAAKLVLVGSSTVPGKLRARVPNWLERFGTTCCEAKGQRATNSYRKLGLEAL